MRYQILSMLVISSLLTGCGNKPKKQPTQPSPSCKTASDTSLDPSRKIQRKTINLKMEKQRTIRRRCDGSVTSDRMEKVSIPSTEIVVESLTAAPKVDGGYPNEIYNRTTCSGRGAEWGRLFLNMIGIGLFREAYDIHKEQKTGFPRMRFSVDTSPTSGSMQVRKNADNYIDYEIKYCSQGAPAQPGKSGGDCQSYTTVEKGTLILTVNYSENPDIGGVREVKTENCK